MLSASSLLIAIVTATVMLSTSSLSLSMQASTSSIDSESCSSSTMASTQGKTALIIGGTSGIGHGIALALATLGTDVTIAGRSSTAGDKIVAEMKSKNQSGTYSFEKVDCFDLNSLKELSERVSSKPLDYLVMTQGMATIQGQTLTKDNLDQKLQLHYFSRVYAANLLAPALSKSTDPRIMTVLSGGVHGPYKNYKDDFLLDKHYSVANAANAAGMYNDLGFAKIAKLNPEIVVVHSAPGFVKTAWGTEMPLPIRMLVRSLQVFGKSKDKCGTDLVNGMLTSTKKGELIIVNQNGEVTNKMMKEHTVEMEDEVWEMTKKAMGNFRL